MTAADPPAATGPAAATPPRRRSRRPLVLAALLAATVAIAIPVWVIQHSLPRGFSRLHRADDLAARTAHGLVVVDFGAKWCFACGVLAPELETLVRDHPGRVSVVLVDTDECPEVAQRFHADDLPLLVVFQDGRQIKSRNGSSDAASLAAWLGLP